jgi:hypothetical protein
MSQEYMASDKETNGEGNKRYEQREIKNRNLACTKSVTLNVHSALKFANSPMTKRVNCEPISFDAERCIVG